jgi:hypothetical protein
VTTGDIPDPARQVQRTYLVLTLLTTLAASFIWGINTLFLLDAGLDNTQAYGPSYVVAAVIQLLSVPFVVLARREKASSDPITESAEHRAPTTAPRPAR